MSHILGFQKWVGVEVILLIYRVILTIDVVTEAGYCLKAEKLKLISEQSCSSQMYLHVRELNCYTGKKRHSALKAETVFHFLLIS